jgi:hypothetical protein
MQLKKTELTRIFNKLNLEVRSTTHHYGWFTYQGKKILRVHYSHGKGDIPGKVSDKIRSQLKLSQDDLRELINCPLSVADYIEILKRKGLINDIENT